LPSTIEQLHREYRARGLAVLAINIEEPPEAVAAWVRSKGVSMDVLLDPPGIASRAWAITATPAAFLIDRDGRVVARAVGTRRWTDPEGRAVIEALLKK
jgi:cytochrome c biogenesis protein CcmG, thiol:disulfide interchange protein DsbE